MLRALVALGALLAAGALAPAAGGAVAPVSWCGTDRQLDRLPDLSGGPQVHVVYAIPADGADRFGPLASGIATDLAEIDAWWRREDPAKAPRFDLFAFPGCGSRFGRVDLAFARLQQPASSFAGLAGRFERITSALAAPPFGLAAESKKYLVFYDGPVDVPEQAGRVCGTASGDPTSGGAGSYAVIFLQAGCEAEIGNDAGNAFVAAHELLHALGALPRGAPNACPGDDGHPCDSSLDVLWPRLTQSALAGVRLDVGRDDYYGHSGGWFDLQDSRWLLNAAAQLPLTVGVAGQGRVGVGPVDPGCPTGCVVEWDRGIQLTLTAEPAGGTRFAGWSGACAGLARLCRVTMDTAKTATATFREAARVTVRRSGFGSVSSAPGRIGCLRTCSAVFFDGQTVTLRARAASGWRFVRWTGACRGARTTCTLRALARGSVATATFRRRR
jgi:hypothetical protein